MDNSKIATAIKGHLVKLATDDKLPIDMNELSEYDLELVIESCIPTANETAYEKAGNYLCETESMSIRDMVQAIAENKKQNNLIDTVEGVVVWQKVENTFNCNEFLELIGYEN